MEGFDLYIAEVGILKIASFEGSGYLGWYLYFIIKTWITGVSG